MKLIHLTLFAAVLYMLAHIVLGLRYGLIPIDGEKRKSEIEIYWGGR